MLEFDEHEEVKSRQDRVLSEAVPPAAHQQLIVE